MRVRAFLGSISGLLPPWWRRWWHTPFVVSEIHANRAGTRHRLLVPQRFVRHIEGALAAHLPNVAYDIGGSLAYPALTVGAKYRLTTAERPLAIDSVALSAGLLSSLQPLYGDEAVVIQILLGPARPVSPAPLATKDERDHELRLDDGMLLTSEAVSPVAEQVSRLLEGEV